MRSVFARAQAVIRTKNWKKENPDVVKNDRLLSELSEGWYA